MSAPCEIVCWSQSLAFAVSTLLHLMSRGADSSSFVGEHSASNQVSGCSKLVWIRYAQDTTSPMDTALVHCYAAEALYCMGRLLEASDRLWHAANAAAEAVSHA